MKSRLAIALGLLFQLYGPVSAVAGEGVIGPVYIENAATVAVATGGHVAGNFEIKLKTPFSPLPGVTCDSTYITTLKSSDPDKRVFALATLAQVTKQPVYLRITDNPTYTAFDGRCSIEWITLAQ